MANPYGAVFTKALSSECTEDLWQNPKEMHKRCVFVFKLEGQIPSGQNPTVMAECTCSCHIEEKKNIIKNNIRQWNFWKNNRAETGLEKRFWGKK